MILKVPVCVPPCSSSKLPACTSTVPVLALSNATPVELTVNCTVPVPCLRKMPWFVNRLFVPPVPYDWSKPVVFVMNVPVLSSCPLLSCNAPAVQVIVPWFSKTRLNVTAPLLINSEPDGPMIVRPVPAIVPPNQFKRLVTVMSPLPVNVPPT